MTAPTAERLPQVATAGAGLVVMLDAAGRTIDALEQQVDSLTRALVAERQERERLAELLATLRAQADAPRDTGSLTPSAGRTAHSEGHDHRPPQTRYEGG